MDLEKTLKAVGKATFVKYYYVFAHMDSEDCWEMFTENISKKTKQGKTSNAKAIFRAHRQSEALKIIMKSPKIDPVVKRKAWFILRDTRKSYGILR